jgi:hypothetical protein
MSMERVACNMEPINCRTRCQGRPPALLAPCHRHHQPLATTTSGGGGVSEWWGEGEGPFLTVRVSLRGVFVLKVCSYVE